MQRGFLYLFAIMDWATRKVLAWWLSNTLDAEPCVEALTEAIARPRQTRSAGDHEHRPGQCMDRLLQPKILHSALAGQTPDAVYWQHRTLEQPDQRTTAIA